MAFPLPPTLEETRRAVAVRLNYGPQAAASPAMSDLLDEFIRQAAREVLLEAPWVELRQRLGVALQDGVERYEFPDNMEPGRLERVLVLDTEDREYELQAGIRPYERSDLGANPDYTDLPLRYEIMDQDLVILPRPNTERYPMLVIEGYARPPEPHHSDDRVPVDKEALIQKATVIGKLHLGTKDAMVAAQNLRHYLERIRSMQSEGETIRVGGAFSRRFPYQTRRRNVRGGLGNYWLYP